MIRRPTDASRIVGTKGASKAAESAIVVRVRHENIKID
jgi:hypothetical protein